MAVLFISFHKIITEKIEEPVVGACVKRGVRENTFNGEEKQDRKGRLLTTKKDYHNHGIGIDSIENTVSKYKGLLDISDF